MKILLVNNYYQYRGGTDNYVDALKKLLEKKNHEVFLYKEQSISINTLLKKIQIGFNIIFSKNDNINKIINEFQPEICHINNIFPIVNFSIIKTCKEKKVPIVQTLHDFRYIYLDGIYKKKCSNNLFKNYIFDLFNKRYHNSYLASIILMISLIGNKKYIENIDSYIFPNKFSYKIINSFFKLKKNKCYILPHFINFHKVKQTNNKDKNKFIYIGRISKEKGIDELVKIFSTLPNLKLTIIGEGPLRSQLERQKTPNVEFLGYVSTKKKYRLLNRALFCIIPSKVEELGPLVLMEAFMCGTPVIIPDLSSFKEKVKNNKSGFFYLHDDIQSFRRTILQAVNTKLNIYNKMSKFVQKEYFKHYSEDIYYKNLIKVYERLV